MPSMPVMPSLPGAPGAAPGFSLGTTGDTSGRKLAQPKGRLRKAGMRR
jgi:hypothetical protein